MDPFRSKLQAEPERRVSGSTWPSSAGPRLIWGVEAASKRCCTSLARRVSGSLTGLRWCVCYVSRVLFAEEAVCGSEFASCFPVSEQHELTFLPLEARRVKCVSWGYSRGVGGGWLLLEAPGTIRSSPPVRRGRPHPGSWLRLAVHPPSCSHPAVSLTRGPGVMLGPSWGFCHVR